MNIRYKILTNHDPKALATDIEGLMNEGWDTDSDLKVTALWNGHQAIYHYSVSMLMIESLFDPNSN
jgi:hypothetical protein